MFVFKIPAEDLNAVTRVTPDFLKNLYENDDPMFDDYVEGFKNIITNAMQTIIDREREWWSKYEASDDD